jgi:hypothetical protein
MSQHKPNRGWRPTEPGAPRLHVLLENAHPALAVSDFAAFAEAGLDVSLCAGPVASADDCPLARGEDCPVAAGADVILFELGTSRSGPAVLEAHGRHHPGTPVLVPVPRTAPVDLPTGCRPLPWPPSVGGHINVLRRAAVQARRRRREEDRSKEHGS